MRVVGIFPTKVKRDLEMDLSFEQPLGIAYVMESARKAGHAIDLYYGNPNLEKLVDSDVVAFSLLTKDVPVGLEMARKVKEKNPRTITVIGGPHISGDYNLVLEDLIDYGVIGEGEETFVELLETIGQSKEPSNVRGIIYGRDGKVISTERRPRIQNLNDLRPIRDPTFNELIDYSFGYPAPSERRWFPIISSRGCTMNCEFCTSKLIWSGQIVYRDPSDVLDEIEELVEDKSRNAFFFDEENLFINPQKAKQLFRALSGKGYNLGSCGDIRFMNKEIANLMKDAGYTQVYWGIESIHPYVLNREKRGLNNEKIMKVLNLFEERGIGNIGMTMIGFDYEKEDDILKYAEKLPNYPIHQLRVSIATPFPGTDFERRLTQKKIEFDPDLSKYDTGHLVYNHPFISPERMKELQHEIVRKFYKSQQWSKRMNKMAKQFPRLKKPTEEFREYIFEHLS